MDVNGEFQFLRKFTKKKSGRVGGVRVGGSGWGVRVNVNDKLKFL